MGANLDEVQVKHHDAVMRIPRFKVHPKACGFRSGVDLLRLNQLSDELETEDFQRKLAAGPPVDGRSDRTHSLLA